MLKYLKVFVSVATIYKDLWFDNHATSLESQSSWLHGDIHL